MQFLIPVRDLAALIDPDEGVADLLGAVLARLVDADVDGQAVLAGFFTQAEDEGRFTCRLAEGDGLGGRAADVVGGFGEEEGLSGCPVSWWSWRMWLGVIGPLRLLPRLFGSRFGIGRGCAPCLPWSIFGLLPAVCVSDGGGNVVGVYALREPSCRLNDVMQLKPGRYRSHRHSRLEKRKGLCTMDIFVTGTR